MNYFLALQISLLKAKTSAFSLVHLLMFYDISVVLCPTRIIGKYLSVKYMSLVHFLVRLLVFSLVKMVWLTAHLKN